jgi:anthranilate phosphoribosyltransferase
MKAIMPVRRALGVRTVFNVLGPLCNPAAPAHMVVGAYAEPVARRMAGALAGMPLARAFVVHGALGWDEPTPVGPFLCLDVTPGRVVERMVDPLEHGVPRCSAADLAGGDVDHNAERLHALLGGRERGGARDALALGAGLALEVHGLAESLAEGVTLAHDAIDSGRAAAVLAGLTPVRRVAHA